MPEKYLDKALIVSPLLSVHSERLAKQILNQRFNKGFVLLQRWTNLSISPIWSQIQNETSYLNPSLVLMQGVTVTNVFLSPLISHLFSSFSAPVTPPSTFLQSVPAYPSGQSSGSGAEKRKHSAAFPEGNGNVGKAAAPGFKDSSSSSSSSSSLAKQPYLGSGSASGEGQSTNQQPLGPCGPPHISESGGTGSGSGSLTNHHSGSVFSSSHFPPGGSSSSHSSQQTVLPQYGGRKILVCTMDNCYCSGVPSVSGHRSHPPYPRSGSFPWVSAQDYPPPPGLASGGPSMQGLAVRDWIDASQTHRHADFYGLYGQPTTKHYVTS